MIIFDNYYNNLNNIFVPYINYFLCKKKIKNIEQMFDKCFIFCYPIIGV